MVPCGRLFHRKSIISKIGYIKINQQLTAIRVGSGSHASITFWSQFGQLRDKCAALVKEFFRLVTAHPRLKLRKLLRLKREEAALRG